MKWVLSKIKAKRLDNQVGIVSFYQETSGKHVELTKSAMELNDALQNINVMPVVIKDHPELLEIPLCKTFLMYVDYNQRNVILEDTKKVLGDLKLTAARAIKKYNGKIVSFSVYSLLAFMNLKINFKCTNEQAQKCLVNLNFPIFHGCTNRVIKEKNTTKIHVHLYLIS